MQKLAFFILFSLCLINCSAENNSSNTADKIPAITAVDAAKLIQNNPAIIVLDIRTAREFSNGHINNALNIDYKAKKFSEALNKLDKNKTYIVHCESGGRSERSLKHFQNLGFSNVYHLASGMAGWRSATLPIVYE